MSTLNADFIAPALLFAVAAATLTWLLARRHLQSTQNALTQTREQVRELEERQHQREREYAEDRNRRELEYHERAKSLRSIAFEEGRQLGLVEAQREHVAEITELQQEFSRKLEAERAQAAQEARERTRAELETQVKLFDVSVRPYLKVDKVKGVFKDDEQVEAGYQYQLLVNGIPAFQPSVIIEETRRTSRVNEENIAALLQTAERAAKAAAELYLGPGASVAKLGPAIIKRITK